LGCSGAGELPDIEIKYEEILCPLAALAEQDAIFARLLLTLLCKAVYCLPSVGRDIRADVRIGLEAALQQTCNGISFVSCAQSLCLQDPEIWISPKLVGSVSCKSTNLHSGILLLENEIMHETFPEPTAERNKKRHRGQGGQINLEQQQRPLEDAWLELAQLYKVVGEEDIVLALFQKHLTKHEITHKALEAQLGGDFEQANALYDKLTGWHQNGALEGAVSSTEIDMWYNERLSCLMELNNWNVIIQETLMEITDDGSEEPQYQQLWQPERQDPYLSLFIRGALKVTTHHTSLMEFIQASFEDPIKREVLLKEFGTYLATAAIVNSDWDRACFLLGQCYRNFRKRWSALHPLAVWARHLEVRQLQKIIELDEFLSVIVEGKCKDFPRYPFLCSTWFPEIILLSFPFLSCCLNNQMRVIR
jgi:DNA-dependent protein kinase catalytic subunit